ncbi:non-structural maintenance of chromosomes element 4 homolog A-like [Hyalella azteca]|uniref:Non-structural maintenance of chromosomes element 4 n=1 Tax=Hyalella azteca TaxID=294128 RepID=A0A8B7PG04_HYAAZ|nr:non-structural maintenance of chromosomes element 4 homolog A-like [Hyalella azteca]
MDTMQCHITTGDMTEAEFEMQRQKYRELLEKLQEKAESSGAQGVDPDELRTLMLQGNQIFLQVRRSREAVLDAQFMKQVSQQATLNMRSSHASLHEFKPQEFATKLKLYLGTHLNSRIDLPFTADSWRKLGLECRKSLRSCSGVEPQYMGAVVRAPRAPRAQSQRVKDKEAVKTDLKKVAFVQSEEMQTEEVSRIFGILKRRFRENGNRPLCFFSFIINPHSFVATIENVFHCSFLLRDGHALITSDADGLQLIAPDKPSPEQANSGSSAHQTAVSFNLNTFEECVRVFNIKEPMIPPRAATNGSERT